jgi:hypothetical protein
VIDGVRSDRAAPDADALFRGVSWPNGRAGFMASDIILGDDAVFRVMRVIADPIHYFRKTYR